MKPTTYRLIQALLNWQLHHGGAKGYENISPDARGQLALTLREFRANLGTRGVRDSMVWYWDTNKGVHVVPKGEQW